MLIEETNFPSTTTNLSILSIQLHLWFHLPGVMDCFSTVFEPKPVSYGHSVKPPHLKHFSHLFFFCLGVLLSAPCTCYHISGRAFSCEVEAPFLVLSDCTTPYSNYSRQIDFTRKFAKNPFMHFLSWISFSKERNL